LDTKRILVSKKSIKVSIQTPKEIHKRIIIKNYDLELTLREYFLCLAMLDLGMLENNEARDFITPALVEEVKAKIQELDNEE